MVAYASQQFNDALKDSHTVVSQVILKSGTTDLPLDIVDGNVKQNYDTASRWGMDLEFLVPESYTQASLQNLVGQRTSTLVPYRGIRLPDGTTELKKMATIYPTDVEFAEQTNGAPTLRISGFDQSVRCQGDVAAPFFIPKASLPSDVVPSLLRKKQPSMQFALAKSQFSSPTLLVTDDADPWDMATKLMTSQGQDLYVNREDLCVSSARATVPSQEYVWHYDENNRSDFQDLQRNATNDLFPNVINVVGTNPGAPGVAGQAADMDPASPTYRYGPYGEQTRTFRSELITTSLQATQMATYLLAKLLGPQDQVTFKAIPNPALDVGDTVAVTRASMGLVLTRMIIVEISMPLTVSDSMQLTCRRSILTDTSGTPIRT